MSDFLQNPLAWFGVITPANLVLGARLFWARRPLGTHFTILMCDLDGDDEERCQTRHVIAAFRGQRGVSMVPLHRVLRVDPYARQDETAAQGHRLG